MATIRSAHTVGMKCHPVPFMAFHAATIAAAIPASRDQIGAMDGSFIRKSGSATWVHDYFYNGSAGKAEKGLEISVIAVIDVAGKGKVTPVIISARMQGYIVQLATARPHLPQNLTHLAADSFYSKKAFVDAVIAGFQIEFIFRDAKQFTGLSD